MLTTRDGRTHSRGLDVPPGFPGNDLDDAQHLARFADCVAYAPNPPAAAKDGRLLRSIEAIATASVYGGVSL